MGEALDLSKLVTAVIRPGRSRPMLADSATTKAANGVDASSEHPQVKPRTSLPEFQFDILTITAVESHQLKHSLDPVQTTLGDVQEGTSQHIEILTRNCKSLEADYSHTGAQDCVTCNALAEAPAIPTQRRISMLDHGYSYNSYLPDLPLAGHTELLTSCADANCHGQITNPFEALTSRI